MKRLRPGTSEYESAIGRAIGAYVNGMSLEQAARANRVSPVTLHRRIRQSGIRTRTPADARQPGRNRLPIDQQTFDLLLDEHPRLTPRQIADIAGVSKTCVVRHLKRRGTYQPRRVGIQDDTRWASSLRNRHKVLTAVQLRKRGHTYGQIAIRLNVPRSTVGTYLRQYNAGTYLWQQHPIPTHLWHATRR